MANNKSHLNHRRDRQKRLQKLLKTLAFSSFSFGIVATYKLLIDGDIQNALIIGFLTLTVAMVGISANFISELSFSILEKIEERLEETSEPLATWIVDRLENLVLNFWWALTLDFKNKYYQQLKYTCRDYLTLGLDNTFVLQMSKVFISLRVSSQNLSSVASSMIQKDNYQAEISQEKSIWDFLAAMRYEASFRRIVILGAPGSGKTTLLRYITLIYATNTQRKVHSQVPKLIPILLNLRDIHQEITNNNPPLADLITKEINRQRRIEPLNPPPNWFHTQLKRQKCLVMLDGLDEVADSKQRQQVKDWVDEQIQQYPDTTFILTSRPYGYKSAPLKQGVIILEVRPFSLKQIQQFLRNWYLQTEIVSRAGQNNLGVQEEARKQADDLIERICENQPLADMAVNPLLLTMIATVHRRGNVLPLMRAELYREICQVLLEKRQRAKNLSDSLTASQKQDVLQALALVLMQHQIHEFTLPQAQKIVQASLEKVASSSLNVAEFLKQIRDINGLLVEIELGVYQFSNSIFQYYLAAVEIKKLKQEDILIDNLDDPWWRETIVLYASQSNATNIILATLKYRNIYSLQLALDIVDESLAFDRKLVKEYIEKIPINNYPPELVNFLQKLGSKFKTLVISTEDRIFLFKMILEDLRKKGCTSFSLVNNLLRTEEERQIIFNQFCQEYNYLSLILSFNKEKIEVSEKRRINDFRRIYNNEKNALNRNEIEIFRRNADNLTQLFSNSLGFKILDESATFGQLYGRMIDASNTAFQLNIRSNFPLIYACKTVFSKEDAFEINGLLNKLGIYADFFALLVVFDNYQEIREQVRKSAYKNDFIVLNYDQLWDILAAKSPVQQLTNFILEQIDLVAISPYTVYGPVTEKMFFGRAKEEKTLLQNINRNDYALIANRKTGKSSLLNRIYPRFKSIPNNQVYYFDLQTVNNYDLFYEELAFSSPEFEEEISNFSEFSASSFRKLIRNIKQRYSSQHIIFIFDEVDEFLAYDIQNQEQLFKTFRSLSQRENIHFIFSGTTTLVKRIRNPNSPLFNFCSPIIIGILEKKDAEELIREPMRTLGVKFENEAAIVERILKLSAQHPNLIQYICDALIKIINQKQERKITKRDLDTITKSQEFYEYVESLIWGQSTALERLIIYTMWSYPEFSESEVIENFKQKGIPAEEVKASLEVLLTYSTLSRKNDKYFFTFQEFAKLMDKRRDIQALTEQYQGEVESFKS